MSVSLEELTCIWDAFSTLSNAQDVLMDTEHISDVALAIGIINTAKEYLHEVLSRDLNLLRDAMMYSVRQGVE